MAVLFWNCKVIRVFCLLQSVSLPAVKIVIVSGSFEKRRIFFITESFLPISELKKGVIAAPGIYFSKRANNSSLFRWDTSNTRPFDISNVPALPFEYLTA